MVFAKVALANLKSVNALCIPGEQAPVSSLEKEAIENEIRERL